MYPAIKGWRKISDGPGQSARPARGIRVARLLSARMMVEARVTVKRVLLRRNPEKNSGYSIG
jgi:hypothetical protein